LIGASRWIQIEECLGALENLTFTQDELERVVGSHLDHPTVLDLLERYPSPAQRAALS
jgi:hypothetical protein